MTITSLFCRARGSEEREREADSRVMEEATEEAAFAVTTFCSSIASTTFFALSVIKSQANEENRIEKERHRIE